MKYLKLIFDFYINASIHVAFAVVALVKITELYYNLPTNLWLNCFIFFGTITGYNFVKFAGVAKLHHKSLTNDLKVIQIFSFFSFLVLGYLMFKISINTLLFASPLILLTILYAVPFLSGFGKNLRQISYLKVMVVAFVWAGFTVLIPLIDAGKQITISIILSILQRFLIVIVLILPFDIRDLQFDAISLQTIPRKIGVEKTKRLGVGLMVFALILEYLSNSSIQLKTPFMMFFFLVLVFLMRAKTTQSTYFSSFWVEFLPIVWWLLLLGFHNF